ncbi:MAG TPA: hypothetical protein VM434_01085, partial [Beijerinckiaceae bacterium]|nr:hypothetical protein [Beijerinckiaceae bacterium]
MGNPLRLHHPDDPCPVPEDTIGRLYRAAPPDAVAVASDLPERQRAELAFFCYGRRHLHALGLLIAGTCSRETLFALGGHAGAVMHEQALAAGRSARVRAAPRRE